MDAQNEKKTMIRAAVGFAIYIFLVPAILFLAAGTLKWPMAWVYVVLTLLSVIGSRLLVYKKNPDLLAERAKYTQAQDTLPGDRLLVNIVALYGPALSMLVAGLDKRFGWTDVLPPYIQYAAAFLVALGASLAVWAMVANRYFSAVARIQKDRDQVVVTDSPYNFVRHPAYAGSLFASLAFPFMLNALTALLPALVSIVALIIRTRNEDRMLMQELPGYKEYAQRTRCRLIPGIW